ncbi:prolyl oligopeptidase family serine peptidase [Wukongibacter baidiensis]|uniref:alpha/beta hydrolase family protein n=1 Tax=Wukongibacter baidiensis TaxID=1723361 RepID=UPI003D7F56AB
MKNKFLIFLLSTLLISTMIMGCSTADKASQEKANEFNDMRQNYKTKLITEGPSPMKSRELTLADNASEITFKSGDLSLKAWISKNHEADKKYPAVVYLHGGFGFTEKNWEEAQSYIDEGFILMTPMLRGENGNQGNYELLYGEVNDLIAAAEYLSEQPYVDSDHIFLAGHSLGGGNAVLASMLPSKYNTVATFGAAPLDLKAELDANEKLKGIIPFDINESKEFELRTPVKYPQYVNKPLHMFVETESHLPEIENVTKLFIEKVKENGKEAKYYSVEGDHFSAVGEAIKRSIEVFKGKL